MERKNKICKRLSLETGHHRHQHQCQQKTGHTARISKKNFEPISSASTPPAIRVQSILGYDDTDSGCASMESSLQSRPVFSEMSELYCSNHVPMEWHETARWVKFEEDVEEGGNRWSKPHVATLNLHSLFELRSMIYYLYI